MERGRTFSFSVLIAVAIATPAAAQMSAICEELRGRFVDTTELIGSSAETRDYSRALVRQGVEIRRLQDDMRNQGCATSGSIVTFGEQEGDPQTCDDMQTSLDRMQDNLRKLTDQREESFARGGEAGERRRQLLAALQENGCTPPASATPDVVITNRRQPEDSAPQDQSFIQPQSSITMIETKKPEGDQPEPKQPTPIASAPTAATTNPIQLPPDRPYDPSARKVRQVGPQFLATDQGTLDLKHPKAPGAQPEQ